MIILNVAGNASFTLDRVQALNSVFKFTGLLTGAITISFPVSLGCARQFTAWNATTGAFALTIKTTTVGSVGIAVTQGQSVQLFHDGTDVRAADVSTGAGGAVTSVHGRTLDVIAASGDYTWAQINRTTSSLADITTRLISDTTGTLAVTRGGTGLATIAASRLLYTSAADTLAALTLGTNLSITAGVLDASGTAVATSFTTGVGLPGTATIGQVFYRTSDNTFWGATATNTWSQLYTANLLIDGTKLNHTVNAQTGTTYTFVETDRGKLVSGTNAAAQAYTLPRSTSTDFIEGFYVDVQNRGAGALTITPTVSTIDGGASLVLTTDQGVRIFATGGNYFTQRGRAGGAGSGDVVGPSSATDNAVARFDSTTGKLVQNSVVTVADTTGNMAGVGTVNTHTIPGGTDTFAMLTPTLNDQTGTTYTLVAGDKGKVVTLSNAAAITLTVPSGLGVGFSCLIVQKGAGQVTFTASGTTIRQRQSHTKTAGQYAACSLVAHVANDFILGGDTAA